MWGLKRKKQEPEPRSLEIIAGREGIPSVDLDTILASHGQLFRSLRKEMDFHPDQIQAYFDEPISVIASYCHALPASQNSQYRQTAGLFGKCLRTAFLAQRVAHGMVVSSELPADARAKAERSWRYTAFLAGLIYPMSVLSQLGAKGSRTKTVWRVEAGPLTDWLKKHKEKNYQPYWSLRGHAEEGNSQVRIWVLSKILQPHMYEFITAETDRFFEQLLGALENELPEDDLLQVVIQRAYEDTLRHDVSSTTKAMRGLHVEDAYERMKNVMNVLHQEILDGVEGIPVRTDGRHLYGMWPGLAQSIRTTAVRHDLIGIPADEQTILLQLFESGLAIRKETPTGLCQVVPLEKGMNIAAQAVLLNRQHDPMLHQDLKRVTLHEAGEHESIGEKTVSSLPPAERSEDISSPAPEPCSEDQPVRDVPVDRKPRRERSTRQVKQESHKPVRGTSRYEQLGELGSILDQAEHAHGELGWWTDKGRALPWPEIAKWSNTPPQEVMRTLKDSGYAVRARSAQLPWIHELMHEGKPAMAVIIKPEYWPDERVG